LGRVRRVGRAGDRDTGGDGTGRGGVFGTARGGRGGLATNCVSCCSCVVKAARVELMLFSEGWVWQGRAIYWVAVHWDSPRLRFLRS